MPAPARTASDDEVNCPVPVPDQEPVAGGAITQVHQQVADLLHGPRPVRVRCDTGDVHVTRAGLYDEHAVQALQGHRAVHVEEIGGENRRRLGVQELPPGRAGVPFRSRRDLQGFEDPADGGSANPVAELQQLALDPLVSPAVVLGREPSGQRGDLGADRRPSCPVGAGPLAGDQAAVPAQMVPGVTSRCIRSRAGRSRIRAARTARSAQSSRDVRGCVRRSTETSCRSTSNSASVEPDDRPGRTSQPQSRTKMR